MFRQRDGNNGCGGGGDGANTVSIRGDSGGVNGGGSVGGGSVGSGGDSFGQAGAPCEALRKVAAFAEVLDVRSDSA